MSEERLVLQAIDDISSIVDDLTRARAMINEVTAVVRSTDINEGNLVDSVIELVHRYEASLKRLEAAESALARVSLSLSRRRA